MENNTRITMAKTIVERVEESRQNYKNSKLPIGGTNKITTGVE